MIGLAQTGGGTPEDPAVERGRAAACGCVLALFGVAVLAGAFALGWWWRGWWQ